MALVVAVVGGLTQAGWTAGRSNKSSAKRLLSKLKPNIITSSTAQGGGGSFKNSKPVGEAGCCESRMAERIH